MRDIGHALVEIHGQHDERALVDAGAHRDLLDAFGGHRQCRRRSRRGLAAAGAQAETQRTRAPRRASRRRRARPISARQRSRSWPGSTRSPARRPSLPNARAAMMRAEKIAGDIDDAHEVLSGAGLAVAAARQPAPAPAAQGRARRPACSTSRQAARRRRCWRSMPRNRRVEAALRATRIRPAASWSAPRSGCLRCAPPRASISVAGRRSRRACATPWPPISPISMPARSGCRSSKPAGGRGEQVYDAAAAALSQARAGGGRTSSSSAVMAELPALKLERAAFIVR